MKTDKRDMTTYNLKDFEQIYNKASSSTKQNILKVASKTVGESSISLLIKGLEDYDPSIKKPSEKSIMASYK